MCCIHFDAMNNRRAKNSLEKYIPLALLQGFEKGYSRFACERELEIKHNCNILTPNLWPSTLCLSFFFYMLNRRPWGPLWLSLLHLVSIFSGPQFNQGSRGHLQPGVAFPTTSCLSPLPTLLELQLLTSVLTELYNSSTPT